MSNDKTEIELKNLREIIKILKSLESKYISEFYKEAKDIAKGVQNEVRKAIPASSPTRGMYPKSSRETMAWGRRKPAARSVLLKANRTVKRGSAFAKGKTSSYPLIQVIAGHPPAVMADMAGKINKITYGKESREYKINLFGRGEVTRTHMIQGQGAKLIEALNKSKKVQSKRPSRFFWPGALKGMPEAVGKMDKLVDKLHSEANRELGS